MKEETREQIQVYLSILVLVMLIVVPISWIINANSEIQQEKRDTFCINKGFNESTDHKKFLFDYTHIECNNNQIFEVYMVKSCAELNKWGECVYSHYVIEDTVTTTTFQRVNN